MPGRYTGDGTASVGGLRAIARRAVADFSEDRTRAATSARDLLDRTDDAHVASMSHWVLAAAALGAGDLASAQVHIDEAVVAARHANDVELEGRALATAMGIAAQSGDPDRALALGDEASALLKGAELSRVLINRGTVLATALGRYRQALEVFDAVERSNPDLPPHQWAVLGFNRAMQRIRLGELELAQVELEHVLAHYASVGNRDAVNETSRHLALVASLRGDHPTVFEIYQQLRDDGDHPLTVVDLCQSLRRARLLREAGDLIEQHRVVIDADRSDEAAIRLAIEAVGINSDAGRHDEADRLARRTVERAEEVDNEGLLAEALAASAEVALASGRRMTLTGERSPLSVARSLDDVGATARASEVRVLAAHAACYAGDLHDARALLAELGGMTQSRGRSGTERALVLHAAALSALVDGSPGLARRRLAAALAAIDRDRSTIAAAELRAAASDRAPLIADLGLRLAVQSGRARTVLEWAERSRASGLRLAGPRPPERRVVERPLARLRSSYRKTGHFASVDQAEVAAAVRALRRPAAMQPPAGSAELVAALAAAGTTLVEFIEIDGRLGACVVASGRVRIEWLTVSMVEVTERVGKLLFAQRRLTGGRQESTSPVEALMEATASRLSDALFGCLTGPGDLVVVPTGSLHHVPWALLPALDARSFVVAPSAEMWRRAAKREHELDSVLIATSGQLTAATEEVAEVAKLWGPAASMSTNLCVDELVDSMRGAACAHLACHGDFRTDSPQFSSLALSDGPFTVYDLDRVDRVPSTVIFSACSLGASEVRVGDDLLGFPATLLERGVRSLVAAVIPVEDGASKDVMVELHRALISGLTPSAALAMARARVRPLGPRHRATAAAFQCFGAG